MSDYKKLQTFVEAALTNPKHPIYQMGYSKHPYLQSYALNVTMMETITPQKWFEENEQRTADLAEVMRLCQEDAIKEALPPPQAGGAPPQPPPPAGAPPPAGQAADPMTMLTQIHSMMSQMMAMMQKDAQTDASEPGSGGAQGGAAQ